MRINLISAILACERTGDGLKGLKTMAGLKALFGVSLAGLLLAGCASVGGGGTGALALAPTGGATAAAPAPLDSSAQRAARAAEQQALEFGRTGVPVPWKSGRAKGEVIPGAKYQINAFACRDYTQTIFVGSEKQTLRATSCRQADGTWSPLT